MKIGIVGAGPAGLCAIKNALAFNCEVTAFEQSDTIGGTWNYTDETEKDKYDNDVHSSMYAGLLTNIPKEIMSYPGFPFQTNETSYVSSEEILKYFHLYAETFDLRQHIKFQHHVVRIRPRFDDKWEFTVRNLRQDKCETFIFDAVLVCNGFSIPFIPKIPEREMFTGKQMHSHQYRSSASYQNENVLVIGGGPSGIDLFRDIANVAKHCVWSHHMIESFGKKVSITLPATAVEKPDVLKFTENGVQFTDGSSEEFSTVIYATGYDYKFPFLSIDCGLSCNEKYVEPLYKHCINIHRPSMAIIGIPYFAVAMPLFDLQVRFCLTFMTLKKQLPSKEEMLLDMEVDINERRTRLKKHKLHFLGMEKHAEYYEDLSTNAEIEPLKPVIAKIFNKSFTNFFDNFNSFRSFNYKIIDDETFIIT